MNFSINGIADAATEALQGEPARFIGYGAAIVVVGVVAVSNYLGIARFGTNISLVDALVLTTAGVTTVTGIVESIRKFVTPVAKTEEPAQVEVGNDV